MRVTEQLLQQDLSHIALSINSKTAADVEVALAAESKTIDDFMALVSPAATQYLEEMAAQSQQLTRHRFGNTMNLFVPLYLSNLCANECTYCGFTMSNKIKRTTLTVEETQNEINAIKAMGFDHVLLVTGEHETKVGIRLVKMTTASSRTSV